MRLAALPFDKTPESPRFDHNPRRCVRHRRLIQPCRIEEQKEDEPNWFLSIQAAVGKLERGQSIIIVTRPLPGADGIDALNRALKKPEHVIDAVNGQVNDWAAAFLAVSQPILSAPAWIG